MDDRKSGARPPKVKREHAQSRVPRKSHPRDGNKRRDSHNNSKALELKPIEEAYDPDKFDIEDFRDEDENVAIRTTDFYAENEELLLRGLKNSTQLSSGPCLSFTNSLLQWKSGLALSPP